jgi:Tol biopolymer transport system component
MRPLAALLFGLALAGCGDAPDTREGSQEERIAFVGEPDTDEAVVAAIAPDGTGHEWITALGPAVQPWPESPAVSADGRRIAFVGVHRREDPYKTTRELYVIDADGGGQRRLTMNTTQELDVDWLPDGRLVFVSCQSVQWRGEPPACDLVARPPDRDDREVLATIPLTYDFAVSPDGGRLAYSKQEGQSHFQHYEIYVAQIDGSNRRRLTHNGSADAFPAWSPDGKRIAFVSNRAESAPCFYYDCGGFTNELYVMDADGSNVRRLTETEEEELTPSWSPDGRLIVYARVAGENEPHDLYVANADGTCATKLTNGVAPDWYGPTGEERGPLDVVRRLLRFCEDD